MQIAAMLDSEVRVDEVSPTFWVEIQTSGGASVEISDWELRNSDFCGQKVYYIVDLHKAAFVFCSF